MSSIYLQTNILNIFNIAEMYANIEKIYFPVRLDQRTRLYCSPYFLNYQSTDLAKSLLLLAESSYFNKQNETAINYLLSYGAILFDGDLTKKSLSYRTK
jgi:DNA-directed RNA polymerase